MSGRHRIVHLGLGNFHRAHQACYTADANTTADEWVITGVAHRSRRVVNALRAQDMRYTVLTVEGAQVSAEPVDVITEALVAADEPDTVVARIADAATRIVTVTITEAGYTADNALISLLRKGLLARAEMPITVLSCDNLAGNGDVLHGLLPDVAGAAFPNTMVDRIVPATTLRHVQLAREAGFDDAVPVPAEPFRQWVIQPDFAAERPAWDAQFTEDVAAWEAVKVRLLNGTHSLIAYLGLLSGHEYIAAAVTDDHIRAAAERAGDEYEQTLRLPDGLDVAAYRTQVLHRFGNRALGHRADQVGSDGSRKLAQRIPEPVRHHARNGSVPDALALTVAAFLQCWRPDADLPGTLVDPDADRLRSLTAGYAEPRELARAAITELFGELPDPFVDRVGALLQTLAGHGVAGAVREVAR